VGVANAANSGRTKPPTYVGRRSFDRLVVVDLLGRYKRKQRFQRLCCKHVRVWQAIDEFDFIVFAAVVVITFWHKQVIVYLVIEIERRHHIFDTGHRFQWLTVGH
jgi:hypothetical protein